MCSGKEKLSKKRIAGEGFIRYGSFEVIGVLNKGGFSD